MTSWEIQVSSQDLAVRSRGTRCSSWYDMKSCWMEGWPDTVAVQQPNRAMKRQGSR